MKALVYTQPNELQLQERPRPELVAGEVVLKIDAVGICGSDMHAYHGFDTPESPVKVRKGIGSLKKGEAHVGTNEAAREAAIAEVRRIFEAQFGVP